MKTKSLILVLLLLIATTVDSQQQCAISVTRTGVNMGPLTQSANTHYFVDGTGKVIYLTGSHTWNDFDNTSLAAVPAEFPFAQFVSMLVSSGHNFTFLWHKDLPRECNWQNSSNYNLADGATFGPWQRTGPGNASDGLPKFDLTKFNQAFFDRMRTRVITLEKNGIYVGVELFDGNNLTSTRCGTNVSPNGDGFPLTSANNINGVDDGYTGSGACGVGSVTMSGNNAVTAVQDAYVKKMVDTLNDMPNVIWEVAEEQPGTSFSSCPGYGGVSSMNFFVPHILELLHTYEGGGTCNSCSGLPVFVAKPFTHLAGVGSMNFNDRLSPQGDPVLYASAADWIAPTVTASAPDTFPSNVNQNNQGKLVFNDSDHALGPAAFVNATTGAIDDVHLRDYIWENFTNGAAGLVFMDPYIVSLPVNQRNPCASPVNGICPNDMAKYDPFRQAMGMLTTFMLRLDLGKMSPQAALSGTAFCLANNVPIGAEFVAYAPTGGSFIMDLSKQPGRTLNVTWFDPTLNTYTPSGTVAGGSSTTSFSTPWGTTHDSVLYLVDANGHQ